MVNNLLKAVLFEKVSVCYFEKMWYNILNKAVYAGVISKPALQFLTENGIAIEYDSLVEAIRNRAGTGYCPMETAVKSISEPYPALEAVRQKLKELTGK